MVEPLELASRQRRARRGHQLQTAQLDFSKLPGPRIQYAGLFQLAQIPRTRAPIARFKPLHNSEHRIWIRIQCPATVANNFRTYR